MKFSEFLIECREKDVFKRLSIYVVSSWVLLQVVSLLADPLNLPKSSLTVLLLILIIGFPLYIFFLWQYGIKLENTSNTNISDNNAKASSKNGLEIDPPLTSQNEIPSDYLRFRKMYFVSTGFLGLLSLVAVIFIIRTNFLSTKTVVPPLLSSEPMSDKIAIVKFDNNTGDEKFDVVSKMTVDWIMHGITQNKVAQVISPKIIDDYANVLKASMLPLPEVKVLSEYLKPSKVITGNFYLNKNELIFQSSITDDKLNETFISFNPIKCNPQAPLECIEALKQRILGYFVVEENPLENLQETPPNFEAYQHVLNAKAVYGNDEEYLKLINAAIKADDSYFEPKVNRIAHFYNKGNYIKADSLLTLLRKKPSSNKRQSNLLNMYEALLEGDNRATYEYLKNEYDTYPDDIDTNSSLMTVALQFVNRPEDVARIYSRINISDVDTKDCAQCEFRYYIKGISEIELGNYNSTIELLKPFIKTKENKLLKRVLLMAYIKSNTEDTKVDNLLASTKLLMSSSDWRNFSLLAGKLYLLQSSPEKATKHFQNVVESLNGINDLSKDEFKDLGDAYFYLADYKTASKYLQEYSNIKQDNGLYSHLGTLAICYQMINDKKNAMATLNQLENYRDSFKYGHIDYTYAQYYAFIGNQDKAIDHLFRAVADGKWYTTDGYQNDVLLQSVNESQDFIKILNFWD